MGSHFLICMNLANPVDLYWVIMYQTPLICIGINPSIATDKQTDPTINKLLKIADHYA